MNVGQAELGFLFKMVSSRFSHFRECERFFNQLSGDFKDKLFKDIMTISYNLRLKCDKSMQSKNIVRYSVVVFWLLIYLLKVVKVFTKIMIKENNLEMESIARLPIFWHILYFMMIKFYYPNSMGCRLRQNNTRATTLYMMSDMISNIWVPISSSGYLCLMSDIYVRCLISISNIRYTISDLG